MKSKTITKNILFATLLASMFYLGSCSECNDECPEITQPPIQDLTQVQKDRFPYEKFKALTFLVTEPGRVDTVKLYRIVYDSIVVNSGDANQPPCGCPVAYESRRVEFIARYGALDHPDMLEFRNDFSFIDVIHTKSSLGDIGYGFSHSTFNKYFGLNNEKMYGDTAKVLNKVYYPSVRRYYSYDKMDTVGIFDFNYGYILFKVHEKQKKWELISTELF